MRASLIAISLLMTVITGLALNAGFARFIFANGSDILMELITSDLSVRVLLLLSFFTLAIFANRWKKHILYCALLILVFLLWILSGRMIGVFPDGRLSSGWFYFETARIDICKNDIDCEKVYRYETGYSKKWLWWYKIKNKHGEFFVFAGPFISTKLEKVFEKKFKESRYP